MNKYLHKWKTIEEMRNSGELFESYIQYIYQTLVGAQGKNIVVSRRAMVYDSRGNSYNIDVFYEFDVAGVHHRVAIECKDTRRPVERDDAIAFVGKIRELPSTIGIFISRNGFQSAAAKYLQDHGIMRYCGSDLPHFGKVIASKISPIILPDKLAIGQPFWTIMASNDAKTTGAWLLIPPKILGMPTQSKKVIFPLFYSRPHAELFRQSVSHAWPAYGDSSACVRGIEQSTLRFLILVANDEGHYFTIILPFDDEGDLKFTCQEWNPKDLAQEYSMHDLSGDLIESDKWRSSRSRK